MDPPSQIIKNDGAKHGSGVSDGCLRPPNSRARVNNVGVTGAPARLRFIQIKETETRTTVAAAKSETVIRVCKIVETQLAFPGGSVVAPDPRCLTRWFRATQLAWMRWFLQNRPGPTGSGLLYNTQEPESDPENYVRPDGLYTQVAGIKKNNVVSAEGRDEAVAGDQQIAVTSGGGMHFHRHHHGQKGAIGQQLLRYHVVAMLLIYMALVDLLAADFMGVKLQGSVKLQLKWKFL
ncbi:hypothetical protein Tco_1458148 [Tanacetum coccineum]